MAMRAGVETSDQRVMEEVTASARKSIAIPINERFDFIFSFSQQCLIGAINYFCHLRAICGKRLEPVLRQFANS